MFLITPPAVRVHYPLTAGIFCPRTGIFSGKNERAGEGRGKRYFYRLTINILTIIFIILYYSYNAVFFTASWPDIHEGQDKVMQVLHMLGRRRQSVPGLFHSAFVPVFDFAAGLP